MPAGHATLDQVMEDASSALARMDYLLCESLCLGALASARGLYDWDYYARILLPLQEARRQRRMIAAEGVVRLGTLALSDDDRMRLNTMRAGCVVLTRPGVAEEARLLARQARADHRYTEVLFADAAADEPRWTLRSFDGPPIQCVVPAPPLEWLDRWLEPGATAATPDGQSPADWFIDATESLGDAALATLAAGRGGMAEVEALESCLRVVTDHETIHQRLVSAARAMPALDRKPA